jgi:hypothetical protein
VQIPDNQNIEKLQQWLKMNRDAFIEVSRNNECRKWFRWVNSNETPFPCVCTTRNEECIFAEVYYELSKVSEISNFESTCEEAILDFQAIKNDDTLIKRWIDQNQKLHTEISKFKSTIYITKFQNPYEKLTINVSFSIVIEDFKQIYNTAIELI